MSPSEPWVMSPALCPVPGFWFPRPRSGARVQGPHHHRDRCVFEDNVRAASGVRHATYIGR